MEKSWTFHDALRAVLLFHDGGPWDAGKRREWRRITGTDEATTKSLCDHVSWIAGGGGTFGVHHHMEEGPGERLWGLTPGHVLSGQDVADIQEVISDHNEQIGETITALERGERAALLRIGGDELVTAVETHDEMLTSEAVDRAMAKFRAACDAKRSS